VVGGLVGLGVYMCDRLPTGTAAETLSMIVDLLDEMAVELDGGISWLTPPLRVPDKEKTAAQSGYYNLGVAHGSPGVVSLLASLLPTGINRSKVRRMLQDSVGWILAQRLPVAEPSLIPFNIPVDGGKISSGRLAWCYGDPGVSLVLLSAARALADVDLEKAVLDLADSMVAIPREESLIVDMGICHGTTGMAHICNRLHQATGNESYAEAARLWLRETLARRADNAEFCGFPSFFPEFSSGVNWVADPGLLTGVAGIGLVLLGAVSENVPRWDSFLLMS